MRRHEMEENWLTPPPPNYMTFLTAPPTPNFGVPAELTSALFPSPT